MMLREILEFAMYREKESLALYSDSLRMYKKSRGKNKAIVKLFNFLMKEETKHKQLIQREIKKLKPVKKRKK